MSNASVRRRRWTRHDYDRAVAAGGFGPEIWEMTPQGPPHAAVCSALHRALQDAFGDGCCVRFSPPSP